MAAVVLCADFFVLFNFCSIVLIIILMNSYLAIHEAEMVYTFC